MKTAIRYYSRSGNTKKLADAIGKAIGVSAKTVNEALDEPVDLLFLGGSIYAGKINGHLKRFAEALTPNKVKNVAVFSTAISSQAAYIQIKEILAGKGINVEEPSFYCKGQFLFLNKGHPNEQDCMQAASFAKKLIEKEA